MNDKEFIDTYPAVVFSFEKNGRHQPFFTFTFEFWKLLEIYKFFFKNIILEEGKTIILWFCFGSIDRNFILGLL